MKKSVGFIAIGQGGGNIGALFEASGFSVLYANTSPEDLATLKDAKHKYHIKGGEGSNHDRDKAKNLIANDFENILEHINDRMQCEFIFVVFTSGGGTGSGASPALVDYLVPRGVNKIPKTDNIKCRIIGYIIIVFRLCIYAYQH